MWYVGVPPSLLGAVTTSVGYARWRRVHLLRNAARDPNLRRSISRGPAACFVLLAAGVQAFKRSPPGRPSTPTSPKMSQISPMQPAAKTLELAEADSSTL